MDELLTCFICDVSMQKRSMLGHFLSSRHAKNKDNKTKPLYLDQK